jgi:hypothetical protein
MRIFSPFSGVVGKILVADFLGISGKNTQTVTEGMNFFMIAFLHPLAISYFGELIQGELFPK